MFDMLLLGGRPFPMHFLFAYIDPGSGSIFVQAVIGGILASIYTIKIYWQKLKSGLHGFKMRFKGSPKK